MLAEVSWIFAIPASIFGTICLILSVVICVCGCRSKEHKDELTGVEGRVKITNPDDYQQEIGPSIVPIEPAAEKTQSTAKRSLPDLPVDSSANGQGDVTWEPNGDATSELYATVVLQDEKNKRHNRQKSESDSMSPSLTYFKVNEDHPYDKLKKIEHPYAKVKDHSTGEAPSSTSHNNGKSTEDTYRSQESNVETVPSSRNDAESTANIPAANAIAGHVTASDDLPYMTPPAHFSGDSQDSGKGYTSISVREPLSAIRGESKTTNRKTDPHYATVSDDSDDMYAAIEDPSQVYTSESETYAQIHPGSNRPKSAPQPPSVDSLKQMTITSLSHSRQASSSSLASSTNVSSPKHEKRTANSPLPPTPTRSPDSTEDLYSAADANFRQQTSPRNLEDMYAKVNKKGRRELDLIERYDSLVPPLELKLTSQPSQKFDVSGDVICPSQQMSLYSDIQPKLEATKRGSSSPRTLTISPNRGSAKGGSTESGASESSDSMSYKLQSGTTTETSRSCHSYLSKSTFTDSPSSTPNKRDTTDFSFSSETDPRSGYEKLAGSSFDLDGKSDPGYETVHKGPPSESDPEYEKLKPHNHDYANLDPAAARVDGYADVASCESDGYARVEPHEAADDGYAKVLKHNNNQPPKGGETKHSEPVSEPMYESLGNEFEEPNEPNYESVRFLESSAHIEPPYQLLRECESGTADQ